MVALAGFMTIAGSLMPNSAVQPGLSGAAHAQEAVEVMEMVLGDPDAPVTLIEYASFTCPHCAAFHANVYPDLKADYIDTGKVKFIVREVYFDRPGLWAGIVARCGGGEAYFSIIDMIYAQQRQWTQAGDPQAVVGALRTIAKTVGVSDAELDACLTDAAHAEAMYATFVENADADGVSSTPSFVLDGRTHSNMAYADLSRLLDRAAE